MLSVGAILLFAGVVGFLASAVALADADKLPEIEAPQGITITMLPDEPIVEQRKRQAEGILFASLLGGGVGIFLIVAGVWMRKKARRRPVSPVPANSHEEKP